MRVLGGYVRDIVSKPALHLRISVTEHKKNTFNACFDKACLNVKRLDIYSGHRSHYHDWMF